MSLIDEKVVTDAIAHLKVRYDGCTHQLLYDVLRHIEKKVKGASANGSSGKKLDLEKLFQKIQKPS